MKKVACYLLSSLPVFVIGWIAISFAFTPALVEVFVVFLGYFLVVIFFGIWFMELKSLRLWKSTVQKLLPCWRELVFYAPVYIYWALIEIVALLFLLGAQEGNTLLLLGAILVYVVAVMIGRRMSRKIEASCPSF